jgi:hypothetical protein
MAVVWGSAVRLTSQKSGHYEVLSSEFTLLQGVAKLLDRGSKNRTEAKKNRR